MAQYSDINLKNTSEKNLVLDIDDIMQSIETILFTPVRSRMFNRSFGGNLPVLLFEPMDRITALKILDETLFLIERYEPRVKIRLNNSFVKPNYVTKKYSVQFAGDVVGLGENSFLYRGQLEQKNPLLNNNIVGNI